MLENLIGKFDGQAEVRMIVDMNDQRFVETQTEAFGATTAKIRKYCSVLVDGITQIMK
jgi:hypothetical protein